METDEDNPSSGTEELHDSLQYYFTSPGPGSDCELSSILIKDIEKAEQSIDAAIYNINIRITSYNVCYTKLLRIIIINIEYTAILPGYSPEII